MNRYDRLAARLGLRQSPNPTTIFTQMTSLDGLLDGEIVQVRRIHGANTLITRAAVQHPIPFYFEIGPETLLSKLGHLVGKHDVELGEKDFDAKFKIATKDLDKLRALLTPAMREALDALHRDKWEFVVANTGVELVSAPMGTSDTEEVIEAQLRYAMRVADVLRQAAADSGVAS